MGAPFIKNLVRRNYKMDKGNYNWIREIKNG